MSKEAMKLALEALESKDTWGSSIREAKERAITALREALAEQPAQRQEPVAMDAVYAAWHGAGVDIAGGNWSRFVGMLPALYTSPPAQQQEPVRIYDYVWPQREEHKDECIYACSYTPSQHLERGELLAVVHPSQLINTYLQREGETAENPLCTSPPAQRKPLTVWTEAQHERAYRNSPELHKDVKSLAAFKRVAKEIAAMYGIKENT